MFENSRAFLFWFAKSRVFNSWLVTKIRVNKYLKMRLFEGFSNTVIMMGDNDKVVFIHGTFWTLFVHKSRILDTLKLWSWMPIEIHYIMHCKWLYEKILSFFKYFGSRHATRWHYELKGVCWVIVILCAVLRGKVGLLYFFG